MPIYRGSGGSGNSNTSANANQVAIDAAAAAQSATDAAASAAAALVSENEAESAETNAETSETNAASSATTATTKASEAATSATNAATSATTATTQATTATTQATTATTKASEASTSATNAASSESTATTKAAEASTSATNASNSATASASSATASANSATASANSATASAASAAAAQAAQEAIDGLYLGAQASDPTVDLNGDPVTVGDWYFNTTINKSKIYNGSGWDILTADGSVTSVTGTGTVSGLTLTGTVTTAGNLTLGGALSGITASQLSSQNISQWTNDSGYTTNTGTVTPSSTDTFTNKSGNISQWTNDSGYTTNTGTVTPSSTATFTNKSGNISQWTNDSGYITSYTEADTLDSVTGRGATTTNAVTVGSLTSTGIDDNATSTAITIDSSGSVNITGSVISDAVRTDGTSFSSNVDSTYLIAGTSGWTGATTNWNTYGFQHKIKTDGSGVVRLTIDTHLGEKFSMKNNGDTTFSGSVTASGGPITATTGTSTFGGIETSGIIKSTNGADAIQIFNGATQVGQIGALDTTWLRFNQDIAKNIYTPRYIRADAGFFVDGTSKGINGDGNYFGGSVTATAITCSGSFIGRVNTATVFNSSNDTGSMSVRGDATYPAVISFHRANAYAVNFGLDGTQMKLGGWSAVNTKFLWEMSNGNFHADGDVIAYSTSVSDERFKDDVQPITGALDTIDALQGVTYTWNAGSREGKRDYGLIAQDVEKVLPELVHESTMPLMTDDDNDTLYKTLDYDKLVSVLVQAVSELRAEVEALKNGSSD
jgi:hypothetical protein